MTARAARCSGVWRPIRVVAADAGPGVEQHGRQLDVAALGRPVQRRHAVALRGVHIGPRVSNARTAATILAHRRVGRPAPRRRPVATRPARSAPARGTRPQRLRVVCASSTRPPATRTRTSRSNRRTARCRSSPILCIAVSITLAIGVPAAAPVVQVARQLAVGAAEQRSAGSACGCARCRRPSASRRRSASCRAAIARRPAIDCSFSRKYGSRLTW